MKRVPPLEKPGYEFLPHTTDAYIEARGTTLEQALEYAAAALFDTMCDIKSVSPKFTEEIDISSNDEVRLLYDWLESLLLKFELKGQVYSKFEVAPIKQSAEILQAKARISGEKFDPKRHGAKVEVKAVTYHKMEIVREDSGTTLRFILDL